MRKVYVLLLLSIAVFRSFAQFTPGNIIVSRVGDGSTVLSNASSQVQLVEYSIAGTPTGVIVTLPIVSGGASNRACTNSGSSTTEGSLTQSYDGRYLAHAGYDVAPGLTGVSTSTTDPNRSIVRIDAAGTINNTTSFLATTGNAYIRNSIRSAYTFDGTQFWTSGTGNTSSGGVRYLNLGDDGISGTQISATITNSRVVQIFNDQLYVSAQSGTIRVATVGTGMPTTSGQTITNLPANIPTGTLSPNGFMFFDRDASVPGLDLLYLTSQSPTAGEFGLFKYSFDGTTWTAQGKLADATTNNSQAIGLTGYLDCTGSVVLYLTRAPGTTSIGTEIRTYTDNTAYNSTMAGDGTSILAASTLLVTVAANYGFRGLAMAPAQGYNVSGSQSVAAGNYNIIRVKSGGIATLTGNIVIYDKIVVESGGILNMAGFTISSPSGIGSSFEVQSGGTIKIGSVDGITASSILGNVQTCFRTYNSGANYEYTGTATQSTGNGLPASISGSFKINNTTGIASTGVTLSQPTTVTGGLDLTAGKLTTTAANQITLNYSATNVTNASTNSFISGPVSKVGNNSFLFPIGKGTIYAPIGTINISGENVADVFTAEYKRTNPQSVHGAAVQAGMNHVSYVEYWTLTQDVGGAIKKISLKVNAESFCKVLANTYVSRWNGSLWTSEGSTNGGVTPIPPFETGTITSVNDLSAFGDFSLITDLSTILNPLPIKLISFNAIKLNSNRSLLTWELAACCSRDARFEMQRSADGMNYSTITSVQGSETNRFYSVPDNNLAKGLNYYRLKGIDIGEKISYSKVVAIINDNNGLLITTAAPNPVQDNMIVSLSAAKTETVQFIIYNLTGRPVKQWSANIAEGGNTINVSTRELSAGVYHLAATAGEAKTVMRFVKL